MLLSSKTGDGLDKAWDKLEEYRDTLSEVGEIERRRALQRKKWMWNYIQDQLLRVSHYGQFFKMCARQPSLQDVVHAWGPLLLLVAGAASSVVERAFAS